LQLDIYFLHHESTKKKKMVLCSHFFLKKQISAVKMTVDIKKNIYFWKIINFILLLALFLRSGFYSGTVWHCFLSAMRVFLSR